MITEQNNNETILLKITTISTIAHFATTIQPIVSVVAGLVAIISGLLAARFYYKKTKANEKN